MSESPIIISQRFYVPVDVVWKAISDKEEMKNWYVHIPTFEAVTGFDFSFVSGPENGPEYLHICQIKEVVPNQKISYSWRYEGYDGDSLVTFELSEDRGVTILQVKHEGVDSFGMISPDFSRANFEKGWTELLQSNLANYLMPGSNPNL